MHIKQKCLIGSIISVLTLFIYCLSEGAWIPFSLGQIGKEPKIEVNSSNEQTLNLTVEIFGVQVKEIDTRKITDVGEEIFVLLQIGEYTFSNELGKPKLPMVTAVMDIPHKAKISVEVVDAVYDIFDLDEFGIEKRIMPALASVPKIPNVKAKFVIDEWTYSTDAYYPDRVIDIEEHEGFARGHRLATVQMFPVQYNPVRKSIKCYKRIRLQVNFTDGDVEETQRRIGEHFSVVWENFMKKILVHYPEYLEYLEPLPIYYDIFYHGSAEPAVNALAKWKKEKGFKVRMFNATGWSSQQIDNEIQTEDPQATYLVLIGDPGSSIIPIPAWGNGQAINGKTDLYYAETDGTGYLPDMFYGRISVSNLDEANIAINRAILYEKANFGSAGTYWLKHAALIAGYDSVNQQLLIETNEYCENLLIHHGYIVYPLIMAEGEEETRVVNKINPGLGVCAYTGHGDVEEWSLGGPVCGDFTRTELINQANNPDKYPLPLAYACKTGNFTYPYSDCFGETWDKLDNKGGICYFGSVDKTYWQEDAWLQMRNFDAIYSTTGPKLYETGRFTQYGLFWIEENTASNFKQYYFETYHLFNDPSLGLRTEEPFRLNVSHDSYIIATYPYSTTFEVHVEDNDGFPIEDALVCCWISAQTPEVHEAAYTNGNGDAYLDVSPKTPGQYMVVTVTAHNYYPYSKNVSVVELANPPDASLSWPNESGLILGKGSKYRILFEASSGNSIDLVYALLSTDGGGSFMPNQIGSKEYPEHPHSVSDALDWDIGMEVPETNQGRVQITALDAYERTGNDMSDNDFMIINFDDSFWEMRKDGGCFDVQIHPIYTNIVYAVTGEAGYGQYVWKSTDYGQTWNCVFYQGSYNLRPHTVSVHYRNPDVVVVGGEASGNNSPAYHSSDGGATWNVYNFSSHFRDIKIREIKFSKHANYSSILAIGSAYNTVTQETFEAIFHDHTDWNGIPAGYWVNIYHNLPDNIIINDIVPNPEHPDILYVGVRGRSTERPDWDNTGIWRSLDSGTTWHQHSNGLVNSNYVPSIGCIVINPKDPREMYAAVNTDYFQFIGWTPGIWGIFKSQDSGNNWYPINRGGIEQETFISSLQIHQGNPSILIAGTVGSEAQYGWQGNDVTRVYLTLNGGKSWLSTRDIIPDSFYNTRCVALNPAYIGDEHNDLVFYSGYTYPDDPIGKNGVYRYDPTDVSPPETYLFSANPYSSGTIMLEWSYSKKTTGYKIFYGLQSGNYTGVIDVGNTNSHPVGGLNPGQEYYFALKSYNRAGESSFSNERSGICASWPTGNNAPYTAPVIVDINNDSKDEVVVGGADVVEVYTAYGTLLGAVWPFSVSGQVWGKPAVGDINDDAYLEIVAVSYSGSTTSTIHVVNYDATEHQGWSKTINEKIVSAPVMYDLDNDNLLEIIITSMTHIYVYEDNGSLKWTQEHGGIWDYSEILGPGTYHMKDSPHPGIGDIDSDGVIEIVLPPHVWDAQGNSETNLALPSGYTTFFSSPVIGDINDDGDLEIIVSAGNYDHPYFYESQIVVYDEGGSLLYQLPDSGSVNYILIPVLGNIYGDAKPEIIAVQDDSECYWGHYLHAWDHNGTYVPGWPGIPLPENNGIRAGGITCGPLIVDISSESGCELVIPYEQVMMEQIPGIFVVSSDCEYIKHWHRFPSQPGLSLCDIDKDLKSDLGAVYECFHGPPYIDILETNHPFDMESLEWPELYHDHYNSCNYHFELMDPTVFIVIPNGGERFLFGSTIEISCIVTDDRGIDSVKLYFSRDNGQTWEYLTTINSEPPAITLNIQHLWEIEGERSENCLIKAEALDINGNKGCDTSNSTFVIEYIRELGFEGDDPPCLEHEKIDGKGVINDHAYRCRTQGGVYPHSGEWMYMFTGEDVNGFGPNDYVWYKIFDYDILVIDPSYLSFWIYVQKSPGDFGHILLDGYTKNGIALRNWTKFGHVFDQTGQPIDPQHHTIPKGEWLQYVFTLYPVIGETLDYLMIGYDDWDKNESGDFVAYVDDIEILNRFPIPNCWYVEKFPVGIPFNNPENYDLNFFMWFNVLPDSTRLIINPSGDGGEGAHWVAPTPGLRKDVTNIPIYLRTILCCQQYDNAHSLIFSLLIHDMFNEDNWLIYAQNAENHWWKKGWVDMDNPSQNYNVWEYYCRNIRSDYVEEYGVEPRFVKELRLEHFARSEWDSDHGGIIKNLYFGSDDKIPTVLISSPVEDDELLVGSIYTISWSATDNLEVAQIDSLLWSIDDGKNWRILATDLSPDQTEYKWVVPCMLSEECRIRVELTDISGNKGSAQSKRFSIRCFNPSILEDCIPYYHDSDKDGYGDPNTSIIAISQPNGYISSNNDCDDTDPTIHPGEIEVCNNIDDNCNGVTDEGCKITYNMTLPEGWSMFSLPVKADSAFVSDMFPGAKVVYGYEKSTGYVRMKENEGLQVGEGYWILLDKDQNYALTGWPFYSYTHTAYGNGWAMIGGGTYTVQPSTDNCSIGVIYEYLPGFGYKQILESEDLIPGKGHWILFTNVLDQCYLMVGPPGPDL